MEPENFLKFIKRLLKRGMENPVDEVSMKLFRAAFTHPSYNSRHNYELLSLLGDTTFNACVAYYIRKNFPDITNAGYFNNMRATLVRKRSLVKIAERQGLFKHVRHDLSEDILEMEYENIMKNTLKAFIGVLSEILHPTKLFEVTYKIVGSFLDDMEVSPYDYKSCYGPISRLNEIYNSQGWSFKESWRYQRLKDTPWKWKIRLRAPLKRRIDVTERGLRKKETKEKIAQRMLNILKGVNITEKIPEYARENAWKGRH